MQGTNTQCSERAGVSSKATQLRRAICRSEARARAHCLCDIFWQRMGPMGQGGERSLCGSSQS